MAYLELDRGLVQVKGKQLRHHISLPGPVHIVGRKAGEKSEHGIVDLVLDSEKFPRLVSRLHARLDIDPAQPYVCQVTDLGSTNGILVNDRRVVQASLRDGDSIVFGGASGVPQGGLVEEPSSDLIYIFRAPTQKKGRVDDSTSRPSKRRRVEEQPAPSPGSALAVEVDESEERDEDVAGESFSSGADDSSLSGSEMMDADELKALRADGIEVGPDESDVEDQKIRRSKRSRAIGDEQRAQPAPTTPRERLAGTAKRDKLSDVYLKPPLEGGRAIGRLRITPLGLKHYNPHGSVEIKYAAIEHVVFQPNNGGTISILQIFLRKPVILQPLKPSVQLLQFYSELTRRSDNRRKTDRHFAEFASALSDMASHHGFTIDPYPDLRLIFEGVPNNEILTLLATDHCIINRFVSQPPFILTLGPHVKAVFFERAKVAPSFDMVFVLQVDADFDVQSVSQIPSKYLEVLKRWAEARKIPYWTSPMSINWEDILEYVEQDPKSFEARGGWGGLLKGSHLVDKTTQTEQKKSDSKIGASKPKNSSMLAQLVDSSSMEDEAERLNGDGSHEEEEDDDFRGSPSSSGQGDSAFSDGELLD